MGRPGDALPRLPFVSPYLMPLPLRRTLLQLDADIGVRREQHLSQEGEPERLREVDRREAEDGWDQPVPEEHHRHGADQADHQGQDEKANDVDDAVSHEASDVGEFVQELLHVLIVPSELLASL